VPNPKAQDNVREKMELTAIMLCVVSKEQADMIIQAKKVMTER